MSRTIYKDAKGKNVYKHTHKTSALTQIKSTSKVWNMSYKKKRSKLFKVTEVWE